MENPSLTFKSTVFPDDVSFQVLEGLLETLDHIKPVRISRAEYDALAGNILEKT
jgi:hypothetical protein